MVLSQLAFFLVLFLFVGISSFIYFKYQKRIKEFEDYVLLNQSIGVVPLTVSIIGISLSGVLLQFNIVNVQIYGISKPIVNVLVYTITSFFLGYVIFPLLLTFPDTYSLGSVMRRMYGVVSGGITSFIASLIVGYLVYYQLVNLVHIAPIFRQNQRLFLSLVGIMAILQAIWISNSTMSAIAILQFIIVTFLLFSLATIVLALPEVSEFGGGIQGLVKAIKNHASSKKDILLNYKPRWEYFLNFSQVLLTFLHPPFLQRILIVRDSRQVKNAFNGFALFHIFLQFFVTIIGLGAILVNIKKYGTTTDLNTLILNLSKNGWIGLFYFYLVFISSVGVISYFLHSLAVELSENVIKPLYAYSGKKVHHDNDLIKIIILIAGSLCVLLALLNNQTYYSYFYPLLVFIPAILAPFIMGCIGLEGNNTIFVISVITFYITYLILGWAAVHNYFPIKEGISFYRKLARVQPFSILASGIAILVAHYWTYGEWKKRKRSYRLRMPKKQEDNFRAIFSNPLLWAKAKLEKYDHQLTAVGSFLLFTLSFPILAGSSGVKSYDGALLFLVRGIGIGLATIMMFHNLFPYFFKRLFPLFWFFTLGYCIPFCHIFFTMCNPHHSILVFRLGLLLLLLRMLVDWRTFVVLTSSGFLAAYGCYKLFVPSSIRVLSFGQTWNIIEVIILVCILIVIFMHYQEKVNNSHIKRAKTLASGFSHDLKNLLQYTYWMVDHPLNDESIKEVLKNKRNDIVQDDQLHQSLINTTDSIKKHLQESEKQANVFYQLVEYEYIKPKDITKVSIRQLIEASYFFIPNKYKNNIKIVVTKDATVIVHPTIIRSAIINLVKNAFWHGQAKEVIIGWDHIKQRLYVQDNGTGIPADKQPYVFDLYYTSGGSGVGLPFIKITLEKTGAAIFYKTSSQGTIMFIPLPIHQSSK